MKKLIALFITTVLYLTPLAVFSQKSRNASNTKTGRLTINVTFEALQTIKINKKNGDYSENGQYTSKFTSKYQYAESNKAISRDGFISVTDPTAKSTTGKFTYEHDGKLVNKGSNGGDSETNEKVVFTGTISETGNGGIEMADSGDSIVGVNTAAFVDATGSRTQTIKDSNGTQVDKRCDIGLTSITFITVSDSKPDASKPPESDCKARMENSVNVIKKASESPYDDNWNPLNVLGNFANGNYAFSFKGSRSPEIRQKNEDGEVHTYQETLTVEGVWTLTSGSLKQTSGLQNLRQFEVETAFLPRKISLKA